MAHTFLVQLSDPHVVAGAEGDDAAAALAHAVAEVMRLPLPPQAVLVSGDLVHDGAPASYARVKDLLAPLQMPVHVIPGNHDEPAALRDAFGTADEATVGDLRLLLSSTHVPGSDGGHLDVEALAERLDDRPTILAMHHPPLRTGVPAIDDIGLATADREALAALLARSPQVLRVVCGHVHRTTFETLGGCGVFTCPSTYLQVEPGADPGTIAFVPRGRGFGIHSTLGGSLVSQTQPIA